MSGFSVVEKCVSHLTFKYNRVPKLRKAPLTANMLKHSLCYKFNVNCIREIRDNCYVTKFFLRPRELYFERIIKKKINYKCIFTIFINKKILTLFTDLLISRL